MKKLTKRDIKIYEGGTVREMLKACLADGRIPTTLNETNQLLKDEIIDRTKFYDTRTTNHGFELRDLSFEELQNIESFYEKGGRVFFLNSDNYGFNGNYNLNNYGRFVGVKNNINKDSVDDMAENPKTSLSLKEQKILWSVLNQAQDIGLRGVGQLLKQYGDEGIKIRALADWLKQTQEEYDIINTLKVKLCGDLK